MTLEFLINYLKRLSADGFEWSPNIMLLHRKLSDISSKINLRRKVKNDTLFLLGENSNYFNIHDENNLKDEFENYLIKKIQNSGHWVHAENPKDFVISVLDFLSSRV